MQTRLVSLQGFFTQMGSLVFTIAGVALTCNLTLLACSEPSSTQSSAMPPERLPQSRITVNQSFWRLERWEQKGSAIALVPKTKVSLNFKDNQVNGSGGCNRFSASLKQINAQLSLGTLETTQRGCSANVMDQEKRFLAALQSVHQITARSSDQLVLSYTLNATKGLLYFISEK